MWDLATGRPHCDPLTGHNGPVSAVAAGKLPDHPAIFYVLSGTAPIVPSNPILVLSGTEIRLTAYSKKKIRRF
jgi:hypothetical protein